MATVDDRERADHASLVHVLSDLGVALKALSDEQRRVTEALGRAAASLTPPLPPPAPEPTPLASPPVPPAAPAAADLSETSVEIGKAWEDLEQVIAAAIIQSREFGALLETERSALHAADGLADLEQLRRIQIGGIEELIRGQRALNEKLKNARTRMRLARDDEVRLREELSRARLLSLTDDFTGLPNRRAFLSRLRDEIGRADRYGMPLAFALIDLDNFKGVNDTWGHAAGDSVLTCYATQVLSVLRHHDLAARYGGEEFAVLLPNTTIEAAVRAIGKVRRRAEALHCEFEGKLIKVPGFSAGVVCYRAGEAVPGLIGRVDRALYRAKDLGRSRTEVDA